MEDNKSGFICKNFDTAEYNDAIEFLINSLNDANEKSRLRSIGQKEFSLTSGIEKYYQAYQRLLKFK